MDDNKKLILIGGILVIGIVIGIGWLIYKKLTKKTWRGSTKHMGVKQFETALDMGVREFEIWEKFRDAYVHVFIKFQPTKVRIAMPKSYLEHEYSIIEITALAFWTLWRKAEKDQGKRALTRLMTMGVDLIKDPGTKVLHAHLDKKAVSKLF